MCPGLHVSGHRCGRRVGTYPPEEGFESVNHAISEREFSRACTVIPGGVDSPVRAFASVGATPLFYDHAAGSHVYDVDGNDLIDFVGSWGPMLLGHRPRVVMEAVCRQLERGTSFGAPCVAETRMAELVHSIVPCVERIRMVSSGTEATMSAIRLARGFTGRDKFIKFEGNYHGHSDALLVAAGSGVVTFGIPGTPGVTAGAVADTIVVRYNDLDGVKEAFARYPGQIAALIVEPVAGNMGVVPPAPGFLGGLRKLTADNGALLIFDEVITGFRIARDGAIGRFGVTPDLVTYGKIIGGGFPVGAFGGCAEVMDHLAPIGPVYQAGTLSGNPVAMEAGIAMLTELGHPGIYEELERKGALLEAGLRGAAETAAVPVQVNRIGSLATVFFSDKPVTDWDSANRCDTAQFSAWFGRMLERGFAIAPSQFEALFLSLAHTDAEIDSFISAAADVLKELA
jgi:glutamate-1-semialdehyde 2,1-aminomutase